MKALLSLVIILSSLLSFAGEKSYTIKVKVDGLKDTTVYLSYYFGQGQYYKDTTYLNSLGEATFSKEDTLEMGMYSVIYGERKIFDFFADKQDLSFRTSLENTIPDMKIKGGKENEILYEYLRFLNTKQKEAKKLKKEQEEFDKESEEYKAAQDKMNGLDEQVKTYLEEFHKKHPKSFTSTFIRALEAPQVPDVPILENGREDSLYAFKYFKSHFFDYFQFTDHRLLRTAAYHEKISYYLEKLCSQLPDSQIVAVDFVLGKVEPNYEVFKYTLSYLISKYERSKLMGMDAVFVHLAKNYYLKNKVDWLDEKQMAKISERVITLEPLLIGKRAPNIIVKDTAQENFLQLDDIKAKYTIVYIWSPECGHCKVATPLLKKLYDKYKSKGVEVFGIGNEFENKEWKAFIRKHDLNWINGSDGGQFKSNFRDVYDVYSTPQTYLLDENKVIISKKMDVPSLEKMLEYYFKINENSKNEK